jgi:hypothetical protein
MNAISKWMITLALLTPCLLAATPTQAKATYTYTYTGQMLTNGTWGPTLFGGSPPPVPTTLSGTITLAEPLNPNKDHQVVTPISWAFGGANGITSTFGSGTSTSPPYGSLGDSFEFSTVDGKITAWAWSVSWNILPNPCDCVSFSGTMQSASYGGLGYDSLLYEPAGGVSHCGFVYECDFYTAYVLTEGTWTRPNSNVDVLYCIQGHNVYKVVPFSNSTSSNVRPVPAGPNSCALPSSKPASWQIQITTDGGETWSWVTLSSLGLGN